MSAATQLTASMSPAGPGLGWAEPCSRGCVQLLTKQLAPFYSACQAAKMAFKLGPCSC